MATSTSAMLARVLDLKRELSVVEDRRGKLQQRLWASIEVLARENLKYDTLVDPPSQVLDGVSKNWRAILGYFVDAKRFRAREVIHVSNRLHKEGRISRGQTAGSARFQLAALEKRGVLRRLGGGNYNLSDRARTELYQMRDQAAGPELAALAQVSAGDAR